MKKHIFGLALFNCIVSATVVVYAVFNVGVVKSTFVITPRESCQLKRNLKETNGSNSLIRQAVFDLKTKQLNLELASPNPKSQIALHFFIKNASGTQYINSADALSAGFNNGIFKATSSYEWLDRLGSYENLYIVPEVVKPTDYSRSSSSSSVEIPAEPTFDADKAVSVVLYSGERGYLTEKYFTE